MSPRHCGGAEAFLAEPSTDETVARRLFTLRLAQVPETGDPVRRRAHRGECSAAEWAMAERLAGQDWRLLTLAHAADGEPVVEVAHEQLLRRWPRLKSWLDEERDFLVWKGQVEHAAAAYSALSEAERAGALLMGRALTVARDWHERRAADLAPVTRDFVTASLAEDSARLESDRRRQRKVLIGTTTGLVVALILAGLAGWQWRIAVAQRAVAEAQTKEAASQRDRASKTIDLATSTATDLIFLIDKGVARAGVPDEVVLELLNQARTLADQLSAVGGVSSQLLYPQAAALGESVRILLGKDDIAGALDAAQKSRDLFKRLVDERGEDDDQWNFSSAEALLGWVLVTQGHSDSALALYSDSLAIRKRVAPHDPSSSDWQFGLASSSARVARLLVAQGDLNAALAVYQDGLEVYKKLALKYPSITWPTDLQGELAVCYAEFGDVLQKQGRFEEALAAYRETLTIRRAMALQDADNTEREVALAGIDDQIGDLLQHQNHSDEALAAYRESLAIRKALALKDPSDADWQADVAEVNKRIGDVLKRQSHLDEALDSYRESLAIRKALVQKDPSDTDWQRDLAVSHGDIGYVLAAEGRQEEALGAYRKTFSIDKALLEINPRNSQWQADLVWVLGRMERIELNLGDLPGALERSAERAKIYRLLYSATPDGDKSNLVGELNFLSYVFLLNRQPANALASAEEALALDPSDIWVETNRAHALLFLGRFQEAKIVYVDNKDKPVDGNRTFRDAVRDDFAEFRKHGIDNSRIKEIEALLSH